MHATLEAVLTVPRPEPTQAICPLVYGLCVNCDHRVTCTLPKPEAGVWHCEEYR